MKRQRDLTLPKLRAQAQVAPGTLDEQTRTVEVCFYSGAEVMRVPMWDDPYMLSFSLEKSAVRLGRFNSRAPLLDNHDGYGPVSSVVLGVIEEAWLAADGGRARVKIAEDRPDILARIKDGVLCNFSMGAVVHQLRDVTEKGDATKRLLAIDWEPMELSIVPVPADPSAQALATAERFPCQLTGASAPHERTAMTIKVRLLATGEVIEIAEQDFNEQLHSKELTAPAPSPTPPAPASVPAGAQVIDLNAARRQVDAAIEHRRSYGAEVERLGREFGMDTVWIEHHQALNTPMDQLIRLATRTAAERAPRGPMGVGIQMGEDRESVPWRMDRMAEALAARAMRTTVPDQARQYARFSMAEMGAEYLQLIGKTFERLHARYDAERIFQLALHSTSDFPLLLQNALHKMMMPAYDLSNPTFRQLGAERQFKDFRPHHFLRPGDFPIPKQVGQGGEYTYGTSGENDETVTMLKYGVIYGLALELLINDDVAAFAGLAGDAANRAADFENTTFFNICILAGSGLGPALRDTVAVYNAAHGNIASTGALSVTVLDSIREKMMNQTSIDGLKLNIQPSVLLCSPASMGLVERLLAPQSVLLGTSGPDTNNWAGKLRPVADANLTGTRLYALADPGRHPQYVYGSLGGQMGPRTEVRNGFNIDGIEFKLSIYFGCGAVDYRAGVTAAGA